MIFDLIIFDCDGTLVDSEYPHNLAVSELLIEQGFAHISVDYVRDHFTGNRFSQILENLCAETGHQFPNGFRERYVRRAAELLPLHQKPVSGAKELVEFAGTQTKICVASNGQRDNVLYSLESAGLLPLLDEAHIFTGLDVENPKPAPDLFLLAAKKMGADPARTLVIEDSVVGVTAGVAAGMTTFGFTGTHHDHESHAKALKSLGAHQVFDALIHIQREIESKKHL
ncbi:MAG: HAD family phosphatase [Alphaproteobacteria bacterium]|nr:HAD family phosphatase [Alphaproteobacteria bacterium]